mmetsp:Transcript_12251/g.28745  ORF Transcript_12251/g.28745 Transcript_12251/m.28745 type:complete len:347 (-) Transcript_12251:584-1624(-)
MEMEATTAPTTTPSEEDMLSVPSFWIPVVVAYISYDIISTIVNVGSLIFLYWFRDEPIVAMGQPRLLTVMCFGSFLFSLTLTIGHLNVIGGDSLLGTQEVRWYSLCRFAKWLWIFSESIVEQIIFWCLYRVYKVMQFRRNQVVLPRHIIAPFLAGMTVPLVVFAVYSKVKYSREPDKDKCDDDPDVFYLIYSIRMSSTVATLAFSSKLQHVQESVGDTRRIQRFQVLKVITASVWIPYYFTPVPNKLDDAIADSVAMQRVYLILLYLPLFLDSVGSAIFLVFPRMYLLWYERVHGELPDHVQVYGGGNVHYCVRSRTFTRADSQLTSGTGTSSSMADLELPQSHQR